MGPIVARGRRPGKSTVRAPVTHDRPRPPAGAVADEAVFDRSRAARRVRRPRDRGPRADGGRRIRRDREHVEQRQCRVDPYRRRRSWPSHRRTPVRYPPRRATQCGRRRIRARRRGICGPHASGMGSPWSCRHPAQGSGDAVRVATLGVLVQADARHATVRRLSSMPTGTLSGRASARRDVQVVGRDGLHVPICAGAEQAPVGRAADLRKVVWWPARRILPEAGSAHVRFLDGLQVIAAPALHGDDDELSPSISRSRRLRPDGIGTPIAHDLPAGSCAEYLMN